MAVDVAELVTEIERYAEDLVERAAFRMLDVVKDACPVSKPTETNLHSGQLRESLRVLDFVADPPVFAIAIGSDLEYASFTDEDDTAPHIIEAKRSPVLRFWWEEGFNGPGIYHFRKVNHPGTKGQHWFETQNEERWNEALRQEAT